MHPKSCGVGGSRREASGISLYLYIYIYIHFYIHVCASTSIYTFCSILVGHLNHQKGEAFARRCGKVFRKLIAKPPIFSSPPHISLEHRPGLGLLGPASKLH